jgi:hypothetical protein
MKYKLTKNTKQIGETTLYQIQALKDFNDVKKGDLGGWIEKESNLSQYENCWVYENACVFEEARVFEEACVYGEARVFENACVSEEACVFGEACLSGNYNYTKGWFIGGDDTGKITNITNKTGNNYWKSQYVLGDYKIEEKEEPKTEEVRGIFKEFKEVVDTFYKDINKLIK